MRERPTGHCTLWEIRGQGWREGGKEEGGGSSTRGGGKGDREGKNEKVGGGRRGSCLKNLISFHRCEPHTRTRAHARGRHFLCAHTHAHSFARSHLLVSHVLFFFVFAIAIAGADESCVAVSKHGGFLPRVWCGWCAQEVAESARFERKGIGGRKAICEVAGGC